MTRLLPLLLLGTALAADPPAVEVGFGNDYRIGPVPVRVRLEGGKAPERGDLVVEVSDGFGTNRYAVPVDLPAGARKSVVVHAAASALIFPIEVWWCPERGERRPIPVPVLHQLGRLDPLVLSVCGNPIEGGVVLPGLLGRTSGGTVYGHAIEAALLPDAATDLASVDLVHLRRLADGDLTPGQIEALSSWVDAGGHLLLTGEASSVVSPRFLPGTVAGRRTLPRFPAFSQLYGPVKDAPGEVAMLAPEAGAEVLCHEGGVPIVTTARRGAGWVTFVAFDPLAEPFRASAGLGVLWDALLLRGRRHDGPYDDPEFQGGVVEVLSARQGPTMATVATGALVVALFLLGLRWVGRRSAARPGGLAFAVFSAPVLALATAIATWVLGGFSRGGDRLDSLVLLEATPGARSATAVSFDAFFHGGAGSFDEEPSAGGMIVLAEVSPLFDPRRRTRFTWREGVPPGLADVEFFPNSSRIFRSIGTVDVGGGAGGDLLRAVDGLHGTLMNGTPWNWDETWVLSNDGRAAVGAVPQGGSVRLVGPLSPAPREERGLEKMARGGRLREGVIDRLRDTWEWPTTSPTSTSPTRGDLLVVAFVRGPRLWKEREGRAEERETVLVVPLLGRDASAGGGK